MLSDYLSYMHHAPEYVKIFCRTDGDFKLDVHTRPTFLCDVMVY